MQSLRLLVLGKGDECSEFLTSVQSSGPQGTSQQNVLSSLTRSPCSFVKTELATKLSDDDEWIRSLTEAETVTADIPE